MQLNKSWSVGGFLFQWILSNLIGIVAGLISFVIPLSIYLLYYFGKQIGAPNISREVPGEKVWIFLATLIIGICLGIFQWLVLRSKIAISSYWIIVTAVGVLIGTIISDITRGSFITNASKSINLMVAAAIIGTILGTSQWLILRKHVSRSSFWIIGSAIGWMLGSTALGIIDFSTTNRFQGILFSIITVLIAMGFYSIITGCLLALLLKQSIEKET